MVPPPPERGAGARPAPPPQPRAPTGAAKNKRARADTPGHRTDRTQSSPVSTNRSDMGGHAPHGQHNARDTRFVACPGKAEGRNEAERPPALQAPPGRTTGGYGARPPPPRPAPRHTNATDPPRGAQPPQGVPAEGTEKGPHARTPAPTTRGSRTPKARPVGGQSGEGGRLTPDAPRNSRRHPPRGRPTATPTTPSQVGGNRDRTAPPPSTPDRARDRGRTRGGARTTWNGPTSAQCRDHARCARHTTQGGRGERTPQSASAHTRKGHAGTTRRASGPSAQNAQTAWNRVPASEGKGHPDRTARHTQRGTRGAGRGKQERQNTRYRPEPPELAASAAHTQAGHCTRQGSSGTQRHAPTPRLGSLLASPRGSHWRQASSTGPAAPAPRATTH